MNSQLSILDLAPIREKRETVRERWLHGLRVEILRRHHGYEITMDAVRAIMGDAPYFDLPPELHRNSLAVVLQGWDRAHDTGRYERSPRGRNLLKVWRIG